MPTDHTESPHPPLNDKRTMASMLEARVRDDIIQGLLLPGAKLRLKELAETYDAGVIPLREALSRLAASGFVRALDQKGFRVAAISAEEINDLTQSRILIECEALRLSISRADIAWEGRIMAAHHCLSRLPMLTSDGTLNAEWEHAQEAFHSALLSNCGSPSLQQLARQLRDQAARYRALSVHTISGTARDVEAEHAALMAATLALDSGLACRLLSSHYQHTVKQLLNHPQLQAGAPLNLTGTQPARADTAR